MPSIVVFALAAGCSVSADVVSILLTIEKPPADSSEAADFNAALIHTSYWVQEPAAITAAAKTLAQGAGSEPPENDAAVSTGQCLLTRTLCMVRCKHFLSRSEPI
jgi:hypothetical protein